MKKLLRKMQTVLLRAARATFLIFLRKGRREKLRNIEEIERNDENGVCGGKNKEREN